MAGLSGVGWRRCEGVAVGARKAICNQVMCGLAAAIYWLHEAGSGFARRQYGAALTEVCLKRRGHYLINSGAFVSEVFVYAHNYRFIARFSPRLWAAQVFCERGSELCSIYCVAPGFQLEQELLEDAIAEWVYTSVICIVDAVRLQQAQGQPEKSPIPEKAPQLAANAALFDPSNVLAIERVPAPVNETIVVEALDARLHRLRQRSVAAVRRFQASAEEYRLLRDGDFMRPLNTCRKS